MESSGESETYAVESQPVDPDTNYGKLAEESVPGPLAELADATDSKSIAYPRKTDKSGQKRGFSHSAPKSFANLAQAATGKGDFDPELREVIGAWAALPRAIRAAVLALVRARHDAR
jgi:hypothetical protein